MVVIKCGLGPDTLTDSLTHIYKYQGVKNFTLVARVQNILNQGYIMIILQCSEDVPHQSSMVISSPPPTMSKTCKNMHETLNFLFLHTYELVAKGNNW